MKREMTITEFASLGGIARARKLSKSKLSKIAMLGAKKRWAKYRKLRRLQAQATP